MLRNNRNAPDTFLTYVIFIVSAYAASFFRTISRIWQPAQSIEVHKKNDDIESQRGNNSEVAEGESEQIIRTNSSTLSAMQITKTYAQFILAPENRLRILGAAGLTALSMSFNFLAPQLLSAVIQTFEKKDKEDEDVPESQFLLLVGLVSIYTLSQLVPNIRDRLLVPVAAHSTEKLLNTITEHQLTRSLDYHINTQQAEQILQIQKAFAVASNCNPLLTTILPMLLETSIAIGALSYQYGIPMGAGALVILTTFIAYCAKTTPAIISSRENMRQKGNEAWEIISRAFERYKTMHDFNKLPEVMRQVKTATANAAQTENTFNIRPLNANLGHILIPRLGMLASLLYLITRSDQFSVSAFLTLFGYTNQLSSSMPSVGSALNQIFASYPDLRFLFNELAKPSEVFDPHPESPLIIGDAAQIRFQNIYFHYNNKPPTFNNFSLIIEPGQTVAIVSESGGGKSTLFNLLYGHYSPIAGEIYINDQNLSTVSRASVQQQIGLIGQNPNLSNGSVRENIKFGAQSDVSDEKIFELAKQLNLAGFICSLAKEDEINLDNFKKGLDVSVGEGGKALSGGQQQKVAILRGFMKENVSIRCLDEITAALDAESSSSVLEGIRDVNHGKTTLVITHHLSEITSADKIVVLKEGRVLAEGTHEVLLECCYLYRNLWIKQHKSLEDTPISTNPSGLFPPMSRDKGKDKKIPQTSNQSSFNPSPRSTGT